MLDVSFHFFFWGNPQSILLIESALGLLLKLGLIQSAELLDIGSLEYLVRELIEGCGPNGASAVTEFDGDDESPLDYFIEVPAVHALLAWFCCLFAFGVVACIVEPLTLETHVRDPHFQVGVDWLQTIAVQQLGLDFLHKPAQLGIDYSLFLTLRDRLILFLWIFPFKSTEPVALRKIDLRAEVGAEWERVAVVMKSKAFEIDSFINPRRTDVEIFIPDDNIDWLFGFRITHQQCLLEDIAVSLLNVSLLSNLQQNYG